MLAEGKTQGVFQLESTGMRNFLMQMRPGNFEDIIAAISLYRPGPMDSIPRFIAGKQAPETVKYLDPKLKPILDVTYGCMVYQEQVMQIVRDLAGYSMGRSDLVRRAMAKKKHDVMNREKEIFVHGQVEGGEVVVPTLNGNIKMNIKAGTQPDSRMRLRGKGLPHYKSEGAGDMIVTIKVVLPTLNAQQAELLKKIKAEER